MNTYEVMEALKDALNADETLNDWLSATFSKNAITEIGISEDATNVAYPFIKIVFGGDVFTSVRINHTGRTESVIQLAFGVQGINALDAESVLSEFTVQLREAIERDLTLTGQVISVTPESATPISETVGTNTPHRVMTLNIKRGC